MIKLKKKKKMIIDKCKVRWKQAKEALLDLPTS